MQELQGQEKEFSYCSELSLLSCPLDFSRTNGIDAEVGRLLVVHEIRRVNVSPFIVLTVCDHSAKTKEARIGID